MTSLGYPRPGERLGHFGVWALALRGDADDSSAGDPPTTSPTFTPSASDPGSTDAPSDGDEAKAIAGFAAALEKQGGFTHDQAVCVSRETVATIGLPALVAAGFFDEDMKFLNPDLADHPEIKSALTSATLTCLG